MSDKVNTANRRYAFSPVNEAQ